MDWCLRTPRRVFWLTEKHSEWVVSQRHIGTVRLYSAIHGGSHWKIQDRTTQIENTDNTQTTHNLVTNNVQQSKTNLPWFSRFYDTRTGNKVGLFYNAPEPILEFCENV